MAAEDDHCRSGIVPGRRIIAITMAEYSRAVVAARVSHSRCTRRRVCVIDRRVMRSDVSSGLRHSPTFQPARWVTNTDRPMPRNSDVTVVVKSTESCIR